MEDKLRCLIASCMDLCGVKRSAAHDASQILRLGGVEYDTAQRSELHIGEVNTLVG